MNKMCFIHVVIELVHVTDEMKKCTILFFFLPSKISISVCGRNRDKSADIIT